MKPPLYLVCNAHLDPVWLWEWEEGLAEALSTFRTAAKLCREFEGFAFCHNEALLYEWIEEYEPNLFKEIRALVREGRWHIMGGWYLQPDCNLPSGESLVRQILVGKNYFREKFDVEPRTAVNLDPFGHTRGLVQILEKSGYHSYLFCRPGRGDLDLPDSDFRWVGFNGSMITAHHAAEHYNSYYGQARAKVQKWIESRGDKKRLGMVLWGVGNHGGGASQEDLRQLQTLKAGETNWEIVHGRPEDYFEALQKEGRALPEFQEGLNPWAVGCYTTMAKVKERHRRLENGYYGTEKMAAAATIQGLTSYPAKELKEALKDLLFSEFHDILPGSSTREVECFALRRMDHGLEILARVRARTFFALLSGQGQAEKEEFPLFVYNPHPRDLDAIVVCELQPSQPNFDSSVFLVPEVLNDRGEALPCQLEKESSNIRVDQRKRVVFAAWLKASAMNRFSLRLTGATKPTAPATAFCFASDCMELRIDERTGLIDRYRVKGADYLEPGAVRLLVMKDDADPWGMKVRAFCEKEGEFTLMSGEESAVFAGVEAETLEPVRVIESGPIRSTVEALFRYRNSALCLRYKIPRLGSEIEIEARVFWMEKDRMLKLSIPTPFERAACLGQVAYGVERFNRPAEELVAQKWVGLIEPAEDRALTVINDRTYGFDYHGGELRISLLRSAAHAALPVEGKSSIMRKDRFETRIDQGEHVFTFWINGGPTDDRLTRVEGEAQTKNEPPMALCAYPAGRGPKPLQGLVLSDPVIQLTAMKLSEDGKKLILRFFEPTGRARSARASLPALNLAFDLALKGFEIRTLAVDLASRQVEPVDLLERRP